MYCMNINIKNRKKIIKHRQRLVSVHCNLINILILRILSTVNQTNFI